MKRALTIIGLGLAGMVLAVAVSVAAFALVGDSLSEPSTGKIQVPAASKGPTDDATHGKTPSPSDEATHSQTPSPSTPSATASPSDDHGGSSGDGGGGGSEPGDDNGGSDGGHGSDD